MKVAVLLLISATAAAEPRSFTQTYEYPTLPEGDTEVALWHAEARDTWKSPSMHRFTQQLQIVYGITDRLEASLFTVFTQATEQGFAFDSLRAQARYRFVDRGEWPLDLALHCDAGKEFARSEYDLSWRLELARDFDRISAVGNVIGNYTLGRDVAKSEFTIGWAGGVTYEVVPKLHIGAEAWGDHIDGVTRTEVGPAIGLVPSPRLWLALTAGFGVNERSEAVSGQLIVGLLR